MIGAHVRGITGWAQPCSISGNSSAAWEEDLAWNRYVCISIEGGVRAGMVQFIKEKYWEYEYQEVMSPNMYNLQLWETSGHAAHYKVPFPVPLPIAGAQSPAS